MKTLFFNNKKGFEAGVIIKWLIGLAILVIILVAVVPKIPLFAGSVSKVTKCGGTTFGGKQGVCIPESQYCAEKIIAGCEDTPGSPVCCFDASVVSQTSSPGKTCLFTYDTPNIKGIIFLSYDYANAQECQSRCVIDAAQKQQGLANLRAFCASEAQLSINVACLDPTNNLRRKNCYSLNQCAANTGSSQEAWLYSVALSNSLAKGESPPTAPLDVTCVCAYSSECSS